MCIESVFEKSTYDRWVPYDREYNEFLKKIIWKSVKINVPNLGSDLDLWEDHALPKTGMKRPHSTQTDHEKTLAGPNRSTRLWLDPNCWCSILARLKMFMLAPENLQLRWKLASAHNVVNGFERSNFSMFLKFYRNSNCAIINIF